MSDATVQTRLETLGLSAEQIAEAADVHVTTAYRWLSGARVPRRKALKGVADAVGVSLQWLQTGEADVEGEPPATRPDPPQLPGGGPTRLGRLDLDSVPPSRHAHLERVASTLVYELVDGDRVKLAVRIVVEADPEPRRQDVSSRIEAGAPHPPAPAAEPVRSAA